MTKKSKIYTTQDIKNNIDKMVEEKLDLDAPVEVSIGHNTYSIESVGHFHAVPNMTFNLKLKNFDPNEKQMTLYNFLKLYNFRNYLNDKENTNIVRIYTDWPKDWFEFGVNDWDDLFEERVKMYIHPDILKQEVASVNYDQIAEVFSITLYESETS